ncbi:MAG: SIS domain-containing protein [Ignavibacteriaceae bacterium]|nr:SIS domain-containing protein [Ignavibacteriaceae bacterium]
MELGIKNGESDKMNKFLSEILEQPKSLELTLDYYCNTDGESRLKRIKELFHKENFQRVIFTGMGSSFFTSYAASCIFNSFGIPSFVVNTSELLYYHFSLVNEKTLLVCISQSGESYEVVKLLKQLPSNIHCIGITNQEKSTLAINTKFSLLSKAGLEEMTSTKTFISLNMIVYILGWYLAGKWGKDKISQIKKVISGTSALLETRESLVPDIFNFIGDIDFLQFIGRGPSYSTVCQSELMFKEAAKLPSSGSLGGEFRHGPIEMVKPGFVSVLFAADGNTYDQSIKMATDIAGYDGKVLLITNKKPDISEKNVKVIFIDQPDEYLYSIQSIIPVQLMVNQLALTEGLEPGNFVHGGKVTVSE